MDTRTVVSCELPPLALLRRYGADGGYTDCYRADIARPVTQAEYVEAFYTTAVFKAERLILRLLRRPSTDKEARELADGQRTRFAAWSVEDRSDDQLLLCDFLGGTRSWLMSESLSIDGRSITRLYFGSAVVPRRRGPGGRPAIGLEFRALMGFHRLYSVILLRAALRRLQRHGGSACAYERQQHGVP